MFPEGLIEKINRLQASIDELNARIILLSENNQDNFQILEQRLFQRFDELKAELKSA